MERAGAHLHVVGLQDHAALLAPELLQRQDQVLKQLGRSQAGGPLACFDAAGFAAFFCMGAEWTEGCGAHYTHWARCVTTNCILGLEGWKVYT